MYLDTFTKGAKTFLYTFAASYTVLNFDQQRFLESLIIAIIASIFVVLDIVGRSIRKV